MTHPSYIFFAGENGNLQVRFKILLYYNTKMFFGMDYLVGIGPDIFQKLRLFVIW